MKILEISDLNKKFITRRGPGKRIVNAVDNVSLSLQSGTTAGLVGESGSGKTTLARMILGLLKPDSGSIHYQGKDITRLSRKELLTLRHNIQVVFQDPDSSFNPKRSMRWSLKEGLRNSGLSDTEAETRILRLVDLVSISPSELDKFPFQFSGGQKQRLAIVRALSMGAEFLILDEPVSSLDVSIQAQIINLLMDLKDELGLTFLFISHDLSLVGYLCDSIHIMYQGMIVESGDADRILHHSENEYTKQLFDSAPLL